MRDMQTITIYYQIIYGLVAVAIAGYATYLARSARSVRARLDAARK
jgi:hypothetical protein